jgi:hypothetical protein
MHVIEYSSSHLLKLLLDFSGHWSLGLVAVENELRNLGTREMLCPRYFKVYLDLKAHPVDSTLEMQGGESFFSLLRQRLSRSWRLLGINSV